MRVCIVGAGWVGCHLACKLKNHHTLQIYSSTGEVFDNTSLYNQNRLHLGYHYARSSSTRNLCKNTFKTFLSQYGHLTDNITNNIYAVPDNESVIDFETYLKIFDNFEHQVTSTPYLKNVSGSITVQEKYINPVKSKTYFQTELESTITQRHLSSTDLEQLANEYDLVINCTNNFLDPDTTNMFWERCVMLVYEKIEPVSFGALTLVDGPFFSLYPYLNDTVTLSHVTHTVLEKSLTPTFNQNEPNIQLIKQLMEQEVCKYFPDFYKHFKYQSYFTSYKNKHNDKSDNRAPIVKIKDNVVNCYTGKIQGIFYIEQEILKLLHE